MTTRARADVPRVLMIAQLPPPIHGASVMNQIVMNAPWLRSEFEVVPVRMKFATGVGDIGRLRFPKLFALTRAWWDIARACIGRRPGFAYFTISPTGPAFWRDLSIVALLRCAHVPIIFHLHGKGLGRSSAPGLRRAAYKWAFRDEVLIQLSWGLYGEIADIVPKSSVRIVPNGIRDLEPKECGRGGRSVDEVPKVLFLSNMVPEKGIYDLLAALQLLRQRRIPVKATFVGPFLAEGEGEKFAEEVTRRGLSDVVTIAGPAYGVARYSHFRDADIFVFPTFYGPEAFPLVVLEAMAAGLPIIASCTGAIPEMLDNARAGVVVPPRSPQILADEMQTLLLDGEKRRRMGGAARARFENNFTEAHFLESMRRVFHEQVSALSQVKGHGGVQANGRDVGHQRGMTGKASL